MSHWLHYVRNDVSCMIDQLMEFLINAIPAQVRHSHFRGDGGE